MNAPSEIGARPLVIIGAGRSGTNMLRDVLTRLDGVTTWPCDEINYIWRHGNRTYPTDEFEPTMATPAVRRFVRGRFASMARSSGLESFPPGSRFLVEKTCANSLRVGFVDAIVPEARYIHLVRDGRDVVASAMKRWKAPLDVPYLVAKARYVPPSDLPYYAARYFSNRVTKLRDPQSTLAVWGPRFEGMRELAADSSLEHVCAAQWVRCLTRADEVFATLPSERVHTMRYEDFVAEPVAGLAGVARFAGLSHDDTTLAAACADVRTGSVGKGRVRAVEPELERVMAPTLRRLGYL